MIVPLFVGREKSIRALEEVMKADKLIMLATQMNSTDDDPAIDAIYQTGTLASVLQLLKLPDGTVKVLVEGPGARESARLHQHRRVLRSRCRDDRRRRRRRDRGRGDGSLGRRRVRGLCEAQQEDLARGRLRGHADRGLLEARRHCRLAPRGEDRRQSRPFSR